MHFFLEIQNNFIQASANVSSKIILLFVKNLFNSFKLWKTCAEESSSVRTKKTVSLLGRSNFRKMNLLPLGKYVTLSLLNILQEQFFKY